MVTTRTPVVFVHGLWLHASSWQPWMELFASHGFEPVAPGWPGEGPTVAEARQTSGAVAGLGIDVVTDHFAEVIRSFDQPPVIIGHCVGGLITQRLLGQGLGRAGAAIGPAWIKGVGPLPFTRPRCATPVLRNPASRARAVSLTAQQFRRGFANAVTAAESDELYELWTIPAPARPLFETVFAGFARNSPAAVDIRNAGRGPLLLVSGLRDRTVPDVITRATHRLHRRSTATTDLEQFPDRGHSLTVDHGWREVADRVLDWLTRQNIRPTAAITS